MSDEFRTIRIEDLVDPPLVLREVNQNGVEYVELRDSLRRLGFLNSICVRACKRDPSKWEVIDGRWRVAAAREVDIVEVPCIVKTGLTNRDILAMQVIANAQRPTTHPTDFAKQIKRLLASKDGMSQAELCQVLNKSTTWVRKMMGMSRLARSRLYRDLIDTGEMSLDAAYTLSRLPPRFWPDYYTDACALPLREFRALVMAALRKYRAMQVQGRLDLKNNSVITPNPYLRRLTEILNEARDLTIGPLQIATHGYKTPLDAWKAALEWAANLDPESCERQRQKVIRRMRKRLVTRLRQP